MSPSPTDPEVIWAGGLFEGEGSLSPSKGKPRVQLQSTDEDVVRRFHAAVGLGTVSGPSVAPSRAAHKPVWCWQSSAQGDVMRFVRLVWPWLGVRRQERARELGIVP